MKLHTVSATGSFDGLLNPWGKRMGELHCMMCILLALLLGISRPLLAETEATSAVEATPRGDLLLVIGSPGTKEYRTEFRKWAEKWIAAAQAGQIRVTSLGFEVDDATLDQIREKVKGFQAEADLPLWIVLIGHGTFDGRAAKFNLPSTDMEPVDLQVMLYALKRPLAVVNCTSASAPFLEAISGPGRVVITSTSSGNEVNFCRFGGALADSIHNPEADLDKDQQVSLLEAFLRASKLVEEFYTGDGRLPTEHAMFDDNGDGRAVPRNGFEGVNPVQRDENSNQLPDGILAHQWHLVPSSADAALSPEALARRSEIELRIHKLRMLKRRMKEDDYYAALEPLFLELASLLIDPAADAPQGDSSDSPASGEADSSQN